MKAEPTKFTVLVDPKDMDHAFRDFLATKCAEEKRELPRDIAVYDSSFDQLDVTDATPVKNVFGGSNDITINLVADEEDKKLLLRKIRWLK